MQAMLLAAGLGTRLKPITDWLPKPLFPVLNIPCLKRHIENLIKSGFGKIIINSFHLSHLIEKALNEWNFKEIDIILLKEPVLLGTGGGIRNALPFINYKEPLLVINSDIITDISPLNIMQSHEKSGFNTSLLTHYSEKYKALRIENNLIKEFGYKEINALAYTGICVLNYNFIKTIPEGEIFCLINAFKNFIDKKDKIHSISASSLKKDYLWEDIGTPANYLNIHKTLLERHNMTIYRDKNTFLPDDVKISGWCCLGKNISIGKGVAIKDSVLWNNAIVPDNADIINTIYI